MLTRHVITAWRCCYATGELERLFAPLAGFLSDLPVARDNPDEIHSAAPGLATESHARLESEDIEEEGQPYQDAARSNDDIRGEERPELTTPARIALLPHDPHTGEEIERDEVVKGYEYERGQFVTLTAEELKAWMLKARKLSISKPSSRAARSTRFISALPITSIRMVRSRLRPSA
jgi:hypothetical protein